jgi:hypothetical protein
MKRTSISTAAALTLAAIATMPLAIAAQTSDWTLDRQHDEAMSVAYGSEAGALDKAVIMHSQVVHQRTLRDGRRFECLKSHAILLYHAEHHDAARLYMVAAAEQAAHDGRDYDAAMAYIDAAILAKQAEDFAAVMDLAALATAHASSLEAEQRSVVLTRIGA